MRDCCDGSIFFTNIAERFLPFRQPEALLRNTGTWPREENICDWYYGDGPTAACLLVMFLQSFHTPHRSHGTHHADITRFCCTRDRTRDAIVLLSPILATPAIGNEPGSDGRASARISFSPYIPVPDPAGSLLSDRRDVLVKLLAVGID